MSRFRLQRHGRARAGCALALSSLCALGLAGGSASAGPSSGQLQNSIDSTRSREGTAKSRLDADVAKVASYQARIDDLNSRVGALQTTLDFERGQLFSIQNRLRLTRAQLVVLQARLVRDRKVLAAQLVADYKTPAPDIVSVVLDSNGFADLIESVDAVKRIEHQNAQVTDQVGSDRRAMSVQERRLASLETRQRQITRGVLIQRNEVASLRSQVVSRQQVFERARERAAVALGRLHDRRQTLESRLAAIERQQAAQAGAPAALGAPFASHGGSYGFFQAAGTNYSVGSEPELARRLDRMGKALHLHLIGISGYRTPQHSVEVGGFADDPHTRGQASDTPGVEGVPEGTLNQYGLTRPFGGAAEADHIQLAGGA